MDNSVFEEERSPPKQLVRSASFGAPEDYHYKIFKDGRYFKLSSEEVEEITTISGFYKILVEGNWLYHPAYCISRVRKPTVKKSRSHDRLAHVSWEDSLRNTPKKTRNSKPRWKSCFVGDAFITRGGRLQKIRDDKENENVDNLVKQCHESDTPSKSLSVASKKLFCGNNTHSDCTKSVSYGSNPRSKTFSDISVSSKLDFSDATSR